MFYLNVPIGLATLVLAWAATANWDTPRRSTRVDLLGGIAFTAGLGALLVGLTLVGSGLDALPLGLVVVGLAGLARPSSWAGAGRTRSSTSASSVTGSLPRPRSSPS